MVEIPLGFVLFGHTLLLRVACLHAFPAGDHEQEQDNPRYNAYGYAPFF